MFHRSINLITLSPNRNTEKWKRRTLKELCCCSVSKLCLTFCDPMDCRTPGFPVLHHFQSLFKLMSIESRLPSSHAILCCPFLLLPSIFPSIGSFPMSWLFTSDGQSIGASVSASVLPMSIQG